ncbi:MAG: hypothetical protein CSA94_00455 [Bacteroidetes bacterium]|nr:MAG: hypothetical protein CSA94_00455 [Bacteroidota bacterium]
MFLIIGSAFILTGSAQSVNYKDYYGYRNQIKTGIGVAYHQGEYLTGYSLFAKYHYYLNKNISLAPEFSVMNFTKDEDELLHIIRQEALQANVQVYLLQRIKYSFFVGGGVNIGLTHQAISNHSLTGEYVISDYHIVPNSHKTFNQFTGGYNLIIGLGFQITPLMSVEFTELYQNGTEGNNIWHTRIGFLVKF